MSKVELVVSSEPVTKEQDPMKLYWLSFCDPSKPEGQQFLGVIMTKALSSNYALISTHVKKINPGGEVVFSEYPDSLLIDASHLDKLLSKQFLIEQGYV